MHDSDKSEFVRFEPECPNCGSSRTPAFARYSDGHAWCFSCGYRESGQFDGPKSNVIDLETYRDTRSQRPIPLEAKPFLGVEPLTWLKKYGITAAEVRHHRLLWWEERKWLIFPYYAGTNLAGWQARNFDLVNYPKQKWLSFGNIKDHLHLIGKESTTVILVEDIVSAIKVGRQIMAMPVYGSHIPLETLVRLHSRFPAVGIWLDKDKVGYARQMATRASQFMTAFYIETDRDPKEHSDFEIKCQLQGRV